MLRSTTICFGMTTLEPAVCIIPPTPSARDCNVKCDTTEVPLYLSRVAKVDVGMLELSGLECFAPSLKEHSPHNFIRDMYMRY